MKRNPVSRPTWSDAPVADASEDLLALYRYFRGTCRYGRLRALWRAVYCLI